MEKEEEEEKKRGNIREDLEKQYFWDSGTCSDSYMYIKNIICMLSDYPLYRLLMQRTPDDRKL